MILKVVFFFFSKETKKVKKMARRGLFFPACSQRLCHRGKFLTQEEFSSRDPEKKGEDERTGKEKEAELPSLKVLPRSPVRTEVNPHERSSADRCLLVGPSDCRERLAGNGPCWEVCLNS